MLSYLVRYRRRIVIGFFFTVATNILALIAPWILKYAIDSLDDVGAKSILIRYGLIIVAVALAQGFLRFLMRWVLVGVSREVENDIRNDMLGHLLRLSFSYFNRTRSGDIMARATADLNSVKRLLGMGLSNIFNTLTIYATAMVFMVRIDPILTLYSLIPLPFLAVMVNRFSGSVHRRYEEIQEDFSRISEKVQENVSGIRVVKAYVQEESELKEFDRLNWEYTLKNLSLAKLESMVDPLLAFIAGVGSLIVLWTGGMKVISAEITLGDFVAFNAFLGMLIWPTMALGWVITLLQRGDTSMGRIAEILNEVPEIADGDRTLPQEVLGPIEGEIEFKNLSFSYNGRPVLRGINLRIEKGMTVAVVGPIGAGKSTLISLIPRFFEAEGGELFIDGMDIKSLPLKFLRKHIGFVHQETFLFSDTLRDNIAYGLTDFSQSEVEEAAAVAQLGGDVADFADRFDTMVGERGVTLSGGQKQRTAIARAVVLKPKILILDDALSSVDTHTEEEILKRLRKVMGERTSIIISHRISTVKDADLIVVLDGGSIVERGTHHELLDKGGLYADMFYKQQLQEEMDSEGSR